MKTVKEIEESVTRLKRAIALCEEASLDDLYERVGGLVEAFEAFENIGEDDYPTFDLFVSHEPLYFEAYASLQKHLARTQA